MSRSVPEWQGATDDTPVPQRVRARVFLAYGGRCYRSGRKLGPGGSPWQIDHIKALRNGGENRESNLAPIAVDKHKEKTAADVAEKAKTDRMQANHLGLKPPGRGWNRKLRRKMNGTVEARS